MKRGRRLFAGVTAVVLAFAVAACDEIGIPVDTPAAPSGIRGTVLLGPTCPVESTPGANDPVPCLTPYAAQLVILNGENVAVSRVTSGNDGRFSVDVPPGDYIVAPATGSDSYPIAQPVPVVVVAGQYVEIEINYDTGIR